MERDTIRRIRESTRTGRLPRHFTPADVNKVSSIHWAGTFLPKHRAGNPGGYTVLFVRVRSGVYRLITYLRLALGTKQRLVSQKWSRLYSRPTSCLWITF